MSGGSLATVARHRWQGTYDVDPWGLDPELVSLLDPFLRVRWNLSVSGLEHLTGVGPAVLVFSRRLGWSEPLVLAAAIRRATGRHVRVVGCPDVAPVGPALRRLGSVLANPDEVAGLLRAGELVAVPAGRELRGRRAGSIPIELLGPAESLDAPVLPVAVQGREAGRRWRVTVGEPVPVLAVSGPLAEASLVERTHRGLQDLLDAG